MKNELNYNYTSLRHVSKQQPKIENIELDNVSYYPSMMNKRNYNKIQTYTPTTYKTKNSPKKEFN